MGRQITLVEEKLSLYRKIKYLLLKPEHRHIDVPIELIEKGDVSAIQKYFRDSLGLESLSLGGLRDRAAILRVSPIFGLSKSQLILAILEKQNESQRSTTETK